MAKEYQLTKVNGFDSKGEPEIQRWPEGHIIVMFQFMPPLNTHEDLQEHPYWDRFENLMSTELGLQVMRDDREVFYIEQPETDSHLKIKKWLNMFWQTHPDAPR
jgi:hypothetical protein